jgi:sugar lactone lactonase YvrE
VWAIHSRSGHVVADWTIPGASFLNDLVVTRKAVWVTDSGVDRLTRIAVDHHGRPTGTAPTTLALTGAWPATAAGSFGANGIRALPDGDLLLNNSSAGGLWDVDRHTGAVVRIPVHGTQLTGGDGIVRSGRTVYIVRGSGPAVVDVLRLRHSDGKWTARYRTGLTDPSLDFPSTATLAGGHLWAVNARFGIQPPATDTADYSITKLPAAR